MESNDNCPLCAGKKWVEISVGSRTVKELCRSCGEELSFDALADSIVRSVRKPFEKKKVRLEIGGVIYEGTELYVSDGLVFLDGELVENFKVNGNGSITVGIGDAPAMHIVRGKITASPKE
jgi:hypothetical protein